MEFGIGGSLKDYIKKNTLNTQQIQDIMLQMAYILNFFKENSIIHKDISLDNIIIDSDSFGEIVIKLIDFGISFVLRT